MNPRTLAEEVRRWDDVGSSYESEQETVKLLQLCADSLTAQADLLEKYRENDGICRKLVINDINVDQRCDLCRAYDAIKEDGK